MLAHGKANFSDNYQSTEIFFLILKKNCLGNAKLFECSKNQTYNKRQWEYSGILVIYSAGYFAPIWINGTELSENE